MTRRLGVRLVLLALVFAVLTFALRSGNTGSVSAQPPAPPARFAQLQLLRRAPDLALISAEDQERIVREALAQRWRYWQDTAPVALAPLSVAAVNGAVAYSDLDGHLNMILPDGSARTSVVTDLANISDVAWSPDYGSLAFVADAEGGRALFTLRLTDRARKQIATGYTVMWLPRWSPDGQWLSYAGMRPTDTEIRAFFAPAAGDKSETEVAPALQVVREPSWLDKDTLLVAGRSRVNVWNIYRVPIAAATHYTPLIGDVACVDACSCTDTSVLVADPLPSPDHTRVAFLSGRTEGDKYSCTAYYGLYVVPTTGGTPEKLADVADSSTTGTAQVGTMAWHPGNQRLGLLAGGSDQVLRLTTVAMDHTVTTLHVREGGGWTGWGWSPDGALMTAGYVPPASAAEVGIVQPTPPGAFNFLVNGGAPAWSERPADTPVDLSGEFLEVTQAIQRDKAPYVPAIAKKDTWVRFSVKSSPTTTANVRAVLHLTRGSESKDIAATPPTITVLNDGGSRDKVEDTFNFLLPAEWTTGTVNMRAEVAPEFQFNEGDYANNLFPRAADPARSVTFEKVNPIKVYYYKFRFTDKEGKPLYEVSQEAIDEVLPYVGWTYPVPAKDITFISSGWVEEKLANFDVEDLTSWANLMGKTNCNVPAGSSDRCLGFVPADAKPYSTYWGWGSKPDRKAIITVGQDRHDYGSLLGHELGHSYGLSHSKNVKIDNYGFRGDATSQQVYTPTGYWDFMCPNTVNGMLYPLQWITAVNFEALKTDIGAPQPGLAQRAAAGVQPYLTLSGIIEPGAGARLLSMYTAERPSGFDDSAGSGPYRIELQAASGAVLASRNFEGSQPDGDVEPAGLGFFVTLPRPAGVAQIVVWEGATRLLTVGPGAGALQVRLTTNLNGATVSGPTRVMWTVSGPTDQFLRYTVEISYDGGATWQVLAVSLTEPSYLLDPRFLRGTTQGQVRVTASDGLVSAAAVSDGAFRVPDRAPVVTIIAPADGVRVPPRSVINLTGAAYDQTGAVLTDDALRWTVDGTAWSAGSYVSVEHLAYGVHVVQLTATDGQGRSGAAQIRIRVTDSPYARYLPVIGR